VLGGLAVLHGAVEEGGRGALEALHLAVAAPRLQVRPLAGAPNARRNHAAHEQHHAHRAHHDKHHRRVARRLGLCNTGKKHIEHSLEVIFIRDPRDFPPPKHDFCKKNSRFSRAKSCQVSNPRGYYKAFWKKSTPFYIEQMAHY